jgi:hypothetical protein
MIPFRFSSAMAPRIWRLAKPALEATLPSEYSLPVFHEELCRDLDASFESSSDGAAIGVDSVGSLRGFPLVGLKLEMVADVDAFDDQDLIVTLFNFSRHVSDQSAIAGWDLAHLQCASERARESPACGGDDVIQCGRMRRVLIDIHAVVLGHRSVHPQQDRLRLFGEERLSERPPHSLDPHA